MHSHIARSETADSSILWHDLRNTNYRKSVEYSKLLCNKELLHNSQTDPTQDVTNRCLCYQITFRTWSIEKRFAPKIIPTRHPLHQRLPTSLICKGGVNFVCKNPPELVHLIFPHWHTLSTNIVIEPNINEIYEPFKCTWPPRQSTTKIPRNQIMPRVSSWYPFQTNN